MTTPQNTPKKDFKAIPLGIVSPDYDSDLTGMILSLENYRDRGNMLAMTTPPGIFSEIKSIFHMLESIGSARIEGNQTTVLDYVETKFEKKPDQRPDIVEIKNMEDALAFIDTNISTHNIDRSFVSEIHKLVVKDLTLPPEGEGSRSPGQYRDKEVGIRNSEHVVVPSGLVHTHMEELLSFINTQNGPRYDLLKTAIAHHRFVWIHPFDNGNGRTVRLFTYAMLLKYGFGNATSRLINPVAIFCEDRNKYKAALARADKGDREGFLEWCSYMLSGLNREVEKIGRLGDYEYLKTKILFPAIDLSLERQVLTPIEAEILKIAIRKETVVNGDVTETFPKRNIAAVSKILRELREAGMLLPMPNNQRRYRIGFLNNYLLRGVIAALKTNGFWQD